MPIQYGKYDKSWSFVIMNTLTNTFHKHFQKTWKLRLLTLLLCFLALHSLNISKLYLESSFSLKHPFLFLPLTLSPTPLAHYFHKTQLTQPTNKLYNNNIYLCHSWVQLKFNSWGFCFPFWKEFFFWDGGVSWFEPSFCDNISNRVWCCHSYSIHHRCYHGCTLPWSRSMLPCHLPLWHPTSSEYNLYVA